MEWSKGIRRVPGVVRNHFILAVSALLQNHKHLGGWLGKYLLFFYWNLFSSATRKVEPRCQGQAKPSLPCDCLKCSVFSCLDCRYIVH